MDFGQALGGVMVGMGTGLAGGNPGTAVSGYYDTLQEQQEKARFAQLIKSWREKNGKQSILGAEGINFLIDNGGVTNIDSFAKLADLDFLDDKELDKAAKGAKILTQSSMARKREFEESKARADYKDIGGTELPEIGYGADQGEAWRELEGKAIEGITGRQPQAMNPPRTESIPLEQEEMVAVISPEGTIGKIPKSKYYDAMQKGFKPVK